jgi:hypothetical protein
MDSRPLQRDEGSVLLWVLGCAAISLVIVAALTQIVATAHQKRNLQYETDAAALAAANSLELNQFRISGNLTDISLARTDARIAIVDRLSRAAFPIRIEELVFFADHLMLRTSQIISSELTWGLRNSRRVFAETTVAITQLP